MAATCKYTEKSAPFDRKMNSRIFVLVAAVLSLLGLIVNAGFDADNVYDMTTVTLFLLAFVFALLGAFLGRNKQSS